jgi:carboxymethylenebutenolidase
VREAFQEKRMSQVVKLQAIDGHELDAYVVQPDGKPWGGLVVLQEIFGVNRHIRAVANRFAQEGFYTVAPALFDRIERYVELTDSADDRQKGISIMQSLPLDDTLKDVEAALRYATNAVAKPAGVVGYCWGGSLAWLSASRLAPAAAVGYYGGQIPQYALEDPRAPVILHFGKQDSHIPRAEVEKVRAANPAVQIYWYDAGHAFNNDTRASYNEKAAQEAMARTVTFLNRHL